jgi:HEAT repeat protein
MSIALNDELTPWIELLRSPTVSDRLVALKTLQHLADDAAIAPVITALQDPDLGVQKLAIAVLGEFANPEAVPALLASLASEDAEIRDAAQSALGELITSDHLLLLLDSLQHPLAQKSILILLRKIHDIQALPAILPFFQSADPGLRAAVMTTLRYLNQVDRCPPVFDLLADPEAAVRREVVLTLGHLSDEGVIAQLGQALTSDTDWQVRRNAAKSLAIQAHPEALPALAIALQDAHWQVRKFVLQALQKTPQTTLSDDLLPDLIQALIQALADEFSDVRKEATIAIGQLGNADALNALQQALDDPDREVCIYAQRAIDAIHTRAQAASQLS